VFRFASPEIVHELTKSSFVGTPGFGTWNGKQGTGFCPCHHDKNPSLRFSWKRNGGTVVKCQAGCSWEILSEWFRKQSYWLDLRLPGEEPVGKKNGKGPVTVENSVRLAAVSLSERRMFSMMGPGLSPSYDDFVKMGIRREAIPKGVRVLAALGLIDGTCTQGRLVYERNTYVLSEDWRKFEPASWKDRKAAIQCAKDLAARVRLGRERRNKQTPFNQPDNVERGAANSAFHTTEDVERGTATGVPARGTVSSTPYVRVERTVSDRGASLDTVGPRYNADEGESQLGPISARARAREGLHIDDGSMPSVIMPGLSMAGIWYLCGKELRPCTPGEESLVHGELIPLGLMDGATYQPTEAGEWVRLKAGILT
jgi:hypothetical protein